MAINSIVALVVSTLCLSFALIVAAQDASSQDACSTNFYGCGDYKLMLINKNSSVPENTINQLLGTFCTVYPEMTADYNPDAPKFVNIILDPNMGGVAATLWQVEMYAASYLIANPQDTDTLTHESFHVCQQYQGLGEQPGWLVEGLADFARNKYGINNQAAGWSLGDYQNGQNYTDGYRVTARFLIWIENRWANSTKVFDSGMRAGTYTTNGTWPEQCGGNTVDQLWSQYTQNPAI